MVASASAPMTDNAAVTPARCLPAPARQRRALKTRTAGSPSVVQVLVPEPARGIPALGTVTAQVATVFQVVVPAPRERSAPATRVRQPLRRAVRPPVIATTQAAARRKSVRSEQAATARRMPATRLVPLANARMATVPARRTLIVARGAPVTRVVAYARLGPVPPVAWVGSTVN